MGFWLANVLADGVKVVGVLVKVALVCALTAVLVVAFGSYHAFSAGDVEVRPEEHGLLSVGDCADGNVLISRLRSTYGEVPLFSGLDVASERYEGLVILINPVTSTWTAVGVVREDPSRACVISVGVDPRGHLEIRRVDPDGDAR